MMKRVAPAANQLTTSVSEPLQHRLDRRFDSNLLRADFRVGEHLLNIYQLRELPESFSGRHAEPHKEVLPTEAKGIAEVGNGLPPERRPPRARLRKFAHPRLPEPELVQNVEVHDWEPRPLQVRAGKRLVIVQSQVRRLCWV